MNYRHAYHTGNFADVLKHIVLTRVLTHLKSKPAPFRVVDLHAGAGRYDLLGMEAEKTGEWRGGIGKILDARPPPELASLLAPYVDAVRTFNGAGNLSVYPGSPLIALAIMREADRLLANELHPTDSDALKLELRLSKSAKALRLDAYQAIKAALPPKERRGAVLVDPPFEQPDEFARLAQALRDGLERFATGTFVVWYPVKDGGAAEDFLSQVRRWPRLKWLDARLAIARPSLDLGLTECGVLIVNPPFTLERELHALLPWLRGVLSLNGGGSWRLEGAGL